MVEYLSNIELMISLQNMNKTEKKETPCPACNKVKKGAQYLVDRKFICEDCYMKENK